MKKILILFAVITAMYSCSNDETFYPIATQQAEQDERGFFEVNIYLEKNSGYYELIVHANRYSPTGRPLMDNIEIEEIFVEAYEGTVSFKKYNGPTDNDHIAWINPSAIIQNVGDDFYFKADNNITSSRRRFILYPGLVSGNTQMIQLYSADLKVKYKGGEVPVSFSLNRPNAVTFSTPNDHYDIIFHNELHINRP